jgi:predicted Zn-ribbon and HTH transcriptional regulator
MAAPQPPRDHGRDQPDSAADAGRPAETTGGTSVFSRINPMRWSLAGLPELEQFDSAEQRQSALERIARKAGSPGFGDWWIAVAILVAAVLAVNVAMRFVLHRVSAPGVVEDLLRIGAMIVCGAVVLRWLHRWGAAGELRDELLSAGIPVCRACGYSLRGHPPEAKRCPECGRPLDARVRSALSAWRRSPCNGAVSSTPEGGEPTGS